MPPSRKHYYTVLLDRPERKSSFLFKKAPKSVADFAPRTAQIISIVNSNDMCVGIYTSQAASVEFTRLRRANYARSGLQRSHSKKRPFRPLF